MRKEQYELIAKKTFLAALEAHKLLGPGLLESVYMYALVKGLELMGLRVETQILVPLYYKGYDTGKQFFIDILVEGEIIIEVKVAEGILPVHESQLVSYMKLSDKKLGFLINFNVVLLKDGFRRKVNNYFVEDSQPSSRSFAS